MLTLLAITSLFIVATAKAHGPLTRDQLRVRAEIILVFKTSSAIALRVSWCESSWRPWAWGYGNAGPFQANYSAHHFRGESVTAFRARFANVPYAVRWAYRLSRQGTYWSDWRWSQHCWG